MSVENDGKGRLSPAAGYKPRVRDKLSRRTPLPGPASGATPRIFSTTFLREKYGNQSRNTAPRAGLEGFRAGKRAAGAGCGEEHVRCQPGRAEEDAGPGAAGPGPTCPTPVERGS